MAELRDDQIDFERVITDPEYRRSVITYLNAQARSRDGGRVPTARAKPYRAEIAGRPALRRVG